MVTLCVMLSMESSIGVSSLQSLEAVDGIGMEFAQLGSYA